MSRTFRRKRVLKHINYPGIKSDSCYVKWLAFCLKSNKPWSQLKQHETNKADRSWKRNVCKMFLNGDVDFDDVSEPNHKKQKNDWCWD